MRHQLQEQQKPTPFSRTRHNENGAYRLRYSAKPVQPSVRWIKKKISVESSEPSKTDDTQPSASSVHAETKEQTESNGVQTLSLKPDFAEKPKFKTPPKTTVKLTGLLKVEPKKETVTTAESKTETVDQPFTPEQLQTVWKEFAEQRKKFQAEYQLLSQPFQLNNKQVTIFLHNPAQETMLANLKVELATYIREKLKNNSITIVVELKQEEDRKVIYTNREKFDYLVSKNPILKELKDHLGLDTDF